MKNTYSITNKQGAFLMDVKASNEKNAIRKAKSIYHVVTGDKLKAYKNETKRSS